MQNNPIQYAKSLESLLDGQHMTVEILSAKINRTIGWVTNILSLLRLEPEIQELVATQDIPLVNAYILARLSEEQQLIELEKALTLSPLQFKEYLTKKGVVL